MIELIAVFAGGGLGSVARYNAGEIINRYFPSSFPIAIMSINIIGSLILGIIIGWLAKHDGNHGMRLLAAVGFCGGFTTFSTFSMESWELFITGRYGALAAYTLGSMLFSVLAFAAGLWIMRTV